MVFKNNIVTLTYKNISYTTSQFPNFLNYTTIKININFQCHVQSRPNKATLENNERELS